MLTQENVIKELAQMAGRPIHDHDDKNKVADEDDGTCLDRLDVVESIGGVLFRRPVCIIPV